ncbi:MAG: hypothetical protein M3Q84_12555 [Actinomycetota bacterium]|nr:hypothetical protein [Actinomycetota bacterium]
MDEPSNEEVRALISTFPGDVMKFGVEHARNGAMFLAFEHHRGERLLWSVVGDVDERATIRRRILDALCVQAKRDGALLN